MKENILGGQSLVLGHGSLEHLSTIPARRAVIVSIVAFTVMIASSVLIVLTGIPTP